MTSALGTSSPDGRAYESAHYIHPYPGTMAPRVARELLDKLPNTSNPSLLDPFAGAGGVLVEAAARGLRVEGWDANPLACLFSRVKLTPVVRSAVAKMTNSVCDAARKHRDVSPPDVINVDYWYLPHVRDGLAGLAHALSVRAPGATHDLLSLAFSRTAMQLSLANPRFQVPVRIRPERYPIDSPIRRQLETRISRLQASDPINTFRDNALATFSRLDRFYELLRSRGSQTFRVIQRSVLDQVDNDRTHDLVLTSPPYPGAQKYSRFSSLSLGWLGLATAGQLSEQEDRLIGREHFRQVTTREPPKPTGVKDADEILSNVYAANPVRAHIGAVYLNEMRRAFGVLDQVISDNGYLVIVAGPSQFITHVFDTPSYLVSLAEEYSFVLKERVDDPIRSRRLMTARNGKAGAIQYEALLTLQRNQ